MFKNREKTFQEVNGDELTSERVYEFSCSSRIHPGVVAQLTCYSDTLPEPTCFLRHGEDSDLMRSSRQKLKQASNSFFFPALRTTIQKKKIDALLNYSQSGLRLLGQHPNLKYVSPENAVIATRERCMLYRGSKLKGVKVCCDPHHMFIEMGDHCSHPGKPYPSTTVDFYDQQEVDQLLSSSNVISAGGRYPRSLVEVADGMGFILVGGSGELPAMIKEKLQQNLVYRMHMIKGLRWKGFKADDLARIIQRNSENITRIKQCLEHDMRILLKVDALENVAESITIDKSRFWEEFINKHECSDQEHDFRVCMYSSRYVERCPFSNGFPHKMIKSPIRIKNSDYRANLIGSLKAIGVIILFILVLPFLIIFFIFEVLFYICPADNIQAPAPAPAKEQGIISSIWKTFFEESKEQAAKNQEAIMAAGWRDLQNQMES